MWPETLLHSLLSGLCTCGSNHSFFFFYIAQRMQMAKKQKDALQRCEQRPHNLPLVEATNAQEKKVNCS